MSVILAFVQDVATDAHFPDWPSISSPSASSRGHNVISTFLCRPRFLQYTSRLRGVIARSWCAQGHMACSRSPPLPRLFSSSSWPPRRCDAFFPRRVAALQATSLARFPRMNLAQSAEATAHHLPANPLHYFSLIDPTPTFPRRTRAHISRPLPQVPTASPPPRPLAPPATQSHRMLKAPPQMAARSPSRSYLRDRQRQRVSESRPYLTRRHAPRRHTHLMTLSTLRTTRSHSPKKPSVTVLVLEHHARLHALLPQTRPDTSTSSALRSHRYLDLESAHLRIRCLAFYTERSTKLLPKLWGPLRCVRGCLGPCWILAGQ